MMTIVTLGSMLSRGCTAVIVALAIIAGLAWQWGSAVSMPTDDRPAAHAPVADDTDQRDDNTTDDDATGDQADADNAQASDDASPEVQLLRDLEAKHTAVGTLASDLTYQIWDAVLERTETRAGRLAYDVGDASSPDDGGRRFAVEFDTLVIGRTRREEVRRYVFSGSWLAEFNYDSRMYIRRQIVPPGEAFDPLKLGEGPFPMPFAQQAEDVLARFDVELIDPPTDGLLAGRIGDVIGMALTPKSNTPAAEELHRVELFYERESLLPVGIVAYGAEEIGFDESRGTRNRTTVWLRDPQADVPVDDALLAIDAPDGWDVQVTTWQDRNRGE